jgi:hypothetical protein
MSEHLAVGGCRCGAVRVRASGQATDVIYCHCSDCRRSSGAPVSLFVGYRAEQVDNERGVPKLCKSSPGSNRSFCSDCGTPLSYQEDRLPGEIYVPMGVFDDAKAYEPEMHEWVSQRFGWLDIRDGLPRYQRSSKPR